jgi:hypothetical protein
MGSSRFCTVEEAADVLNIGRTAAYAGAKRWRETGGTEGIKVVAVGGSLRVPLPWLEDLAGGPIDLAELRAERAARKAGPAPVEALAAAPVLEVHTNPSPEPDTRRASNTRARATRPAPQLDLFEPPAAS